jgi:cardiolipin synthase A/B
MNMFLILFILFHAAGLVLIGHVLLSRKSHASLILWTLWLLLFPMLGIPLYLLLGTEKIHKRKMDRFEQFQYDEAVPPTDGRVPGILQDLHRVNDHRLTQMGVPELLWNGDAYYDALVRDIDAAQSYVHIQTYVWREDDSGIRLLDSLCAAVRRGVEVRILLDEMGSVKTARDFFDPLEEEGGRFRWYSTVQTRRSRFFFNLRNHRKINIIDGRIAYIGGMNIGEEYAGRVIGPWQDLQMRFRGPVVKALENTFAGDWSFATRERLDDRTYYPDTPRPAGVFPVAVVQTGPDKADLSFLKVFSLLCREAGERLDVFTPYFVPNEHLLVTLQITAARGVRVRLLIPTLNEHMYMVDIGRASYEPLLDSGVEVYELPGMVHHAKTMRIDDDLVFVGSHNLDVRSCKLNFELSLCFRHLETAERMDEHFGKLFERAERIRLEAFSRRPLKTKLRQGFVRLFGPVL